jgi:GntR family transcriptional repressor for pyruvate dehydrogenase complex
MNTLGPVPNGSEDAPTEPAAMPLQDISQLGGGRVPERAVAEIRRYMSANGFAPGSKLPPERVFIEQLGVSRSSVREALRVLATMGLIQVRHGDGMYVTAPTGGWDPADATLFDANEEFALRNLVETRLGIEFAAVTAAVSRCTDEDLDRLEALVADHEQRMAAGDLTPWEPLTFELALIEMTGNTWLLELELHLREAWQALSRGLRSSIGRHNEWAAEHRAILASLRSRNVTQAQRLVMAHVSLERFQEDLAARRELRRSNGEGNQP